MSKKPVTAPGTFVDRHMKNVTRLTHDGDNGEHGVADEQVAITNVRAALYRIHSRVAFRPSASEVSAQKPSTC